MGRLHTSGSIIKKKRDASSTQKTTKQKSKILPRNVNNNKQKNLPKRIQFDSDLLDIFSNIDALKSTPSVSKYRPPFLIRTLQSRACRSAIMFGDELTNAEGKALISRLSNCSMPFICAHGRPTLAPM